MDAATEHKPVVEVSDLLVEYHSGGAVVKAVNGLSFTLHKGRTLGLVGETGAGKTTTALSIMRLLPERVARAPGGTIRIKGDDVMSMSEREMDFVRGSIISMVFQDPMTALNPIMRVGEQIKESLRLHGSGKLSKREIEHRVDEVLQMVGIPPSRKHDYPIQFSGGMRQRVVIAIALACDPDVLIADEPTTALDVTIQAQVLSLIDDLRARLGTAMIMITHDLGVVARTCDEVGVMYAGQIVEYGSVEQVFSPGDHHPYTVGLFGSMPDIHRKSRRLTPIDGLMPDPTNLPPGCKFAPRCPRRMTICSHEEPGERVQDGHRLKCHLFGGEST